MHKEMHVVFMGSPEFAVPSLEGLLKAGWQVVAVYTQPDRPAGRGRHFQPPPVKRIALERGLQVLQPESLRPAAEVERLRSLEPGVIIVAGFGQILRPRVLEIPPFGCINVHPSLLPRHRGASPVAGAVLAGDEETGVTLIQMDAGMDTGPIIAQARLGITAEDTTGSLTLKLAQMGAELLTQVLPDWVEGKLVPKPQEEALATYTRPLTKEEGEIDWALPAREIWRRVRAFQPWPGAYTWWQGRLLKILGASPIDEVGGGPPGLVLSSPLGASLKVATGEGMLLLQRVQLEGGRPLPAADFLRGHQEVLGAVLGRQD